MYNFVVLIIDNEPVVGCKGDELLSPYAALHMYGFSVRSDDYHFTFEKGQYSFVISRNGALVDIAAKHRGVNIGSMRYRLHINLFVDDDCVIATSCGEKFVVNI